MAPGIGGNGGGGGGRHTGTVPKTKSHNESSRDYNGTSRRDFQSHFNLPNNLSSFDWQPVNESLPHSRTRKESNTSASRFSESFDTGEENIVSQDNLWFNTAQRPAYNSDDDEVSQASWAENGYKSNNLGVSGGGGMGVGGGGGGGHPDKAQVASRLHQIRDYVSQTMSLMDGLRSTGGQRNMVQHEKLASMLEGLRDSELKLQTLYERLDRSSAHPEGEPEGFPGHQMMEPPVERSNKQVTSVPKTSEAARRNELKKQVHVSQMKLQELHDEQSRLRMLRQRAIDQLNEARVAQGRMSALQGSKEETVNMDNMIQERLQALRQYFDTRVQIAQAAEFDEEVSETSDMQNKLDELQAKKQHMTQLLSEISSNLNTNSNLSGDDVLVEACERNVENQMAELNVMRDTLAMIQSNISQSQAQEIVVKPEPYQSMDKTNSSTSQSLQVKSQQLQEAKSKLLQLQTMLQTVEELRSMGQPVPECLLQLMGGSEHGSSSPTHLERSDILPMELNTSHASERIANSCERERSNYVERSGRSLNSCERERVNQQPATSKHTNQEGKLSMKIQLDDFLRNQDLNLPPPLQSSSFQEPSIATGTWGGSTQSTLDDPYMPEYSGDMNESSSVKNSSSSQIPHNNWRKPSVAGDDVPVGSGASRDSWTSPYIPLEVRRPRLPHQHQHPHQPTAPADIAMRPETQWILQEISELQSQLRQMSGVIQNKFVEKQHNFCPPPAPPAAPWGPPTNMSAALGPYCQYIASVSQWQQQQLLVHSLNQCCQLIWNQQRELAALKEALRLQPVAEGLAEPVPGAYPSEEPQPGTSAATCNTPHSNLSRHAALKSSLSAGPSLAPPTVVTSAHSLPNLTSSQPSPSSPATAPPNNHNLLSLPPTPNPNLFFTDPNFINLYPPYGNNLNFEFPSPVNFFPHPPEPFLTWASQSHPPTTLNNQVPPGNRANNYWDNFRSYSRQNLLSNSGKSNDGIPQRTPLERFFNTDTVTQQSSSYTRQNQAASSAKSNDGLLQRSTLDRFFNSNPSTLTTSRSRKERLNTQSRQGVGGEVQYDAEDAGVGEAAGYQSLPFPVDTKAHVRQQQYPNSFQNVCNEHEVRSARLVNENEPRSLPVPVGRHLNTESEIGLGERPARSINESEPRRVNNDCEQSRRSHAADHAYSQPQGSERKAMVNKRNFMEAQLQAREAKISQLNNYQTEQITMNEGNTEVPRPQIVVNDGQTTRPRRQHPRNVNSNANCGSGGEGQCLRGARRKDNKANVHKECRSQDINGCGGDSLEDCVYSEVAALISANECRPQFLLQLFKDLRLLSACPDTSFQATSLSSIHALAVRSTLSEHQRRMLEDQSRLKEEPSNVPLQVKPEPSAENSVNGPQLRNWPYKDIQPQIPSSCAKLDWEVRSILVEMLPFIKCQLGEPCGPPLLESLRRLILHLVPSQSTQDQLDAQLEDALHKFHGCRLGDVYEEIMTVVADVLISELTFLRLVNTAHNQDQPAAEERGDPGDEAEVEEGAVGGILDQGPSSTLHPAIQTRRTKSETVSEADLAEADQLRHSASGGEEEERGDTAEGFDLVEEDGACAMDSANFCVGTVMTESKTEACWAVEQDRELGLDQVPTRLHNPPTPTTSPEESLVIPDPNPNPESGSM